MDLKRFKIFHGACARRVLLRSFGFVCVLSVVPLLQNWSGNDPEMLNLSPSTPNDCAYGITNLFSCILGGGFGSIQHNEEMNLTVSVVRELMGMQMLNYDGKALSVGQGSMYAVRALRDLGFSNVCGVYEHPFLSSLRHRKFIDELHYDDNSVDFVMSWGVDKVSVPALLVLEAERVLRPGGIGAMLVGISGTEPNSLIRSATPISSLLKTSSVVHVGRVNQFNLVVFKKKLENVTLFEQYRLPADCPSISTNKAFMDGIEPLTQVKPIGFEKNVVYLPKFMDVSSKRRLVYIDIGAGDHFNSNESSWFLPLYPVDPKAFNVYFVDHNASVMLSYVKKPGITFVYHPGLAMNRTNVFADDWGPDAEADEFDFLLWFRETVQYADFVVLKMNAGAVELKFLTELFESGAICFVDELFLNCPNGVDINGEPKEDCMDLFKALRSSGVFVHQWWGY